MMKFYIVTPAYNALQWLQGCVRSVADQVCEGVQVHHHVQDAASADGTVEWLQMWQKEHATTEGYRLTFESAPDKGLYDAINIGWNNMPDDADITAHINADEQYLPDVFSAVASAFQRQENVDMLLTAHLVLDKDMRYICHRRPSFPNRYVSKGFIQCITNTCFYRATSFRKWGISFDISYKSLGDLVFFRDILAKRPRLLRMPDLFGSVFVVTGNNVSWSEVTDGERQRIRGELPYVVRKMVPAMIKFYAALGIILDRFHKAPKNYYLYLGADAERSEYVIENPTPRWGMRSHA